MKFGNHTLRKAENVRDERIKELEEREQILVRANSSANILNNELAAQNQQLREALSSIQRYGLDTLSGRTDGPDDREWQRAGVNELTKRARIALALPDLAIPVLNRVRAEALRYAADEFDAQGEWKGHGQQLRNMADAIEKGENGDSWIV